MKLKNMATVQPNKLIEEYLNIFVLEANLYGIKCLFKAGCMTDKEYKDKRKEYFKIYKSYGNSSTVP
jgi:hypothetical protein